MGKFEAWFCIALGWIGCVGLYFNAHTWGQLIVFIGCVYLAFIGVRGLRNEL